MTTTERKAEATDLAKAIAAFLPGWEQYDRPGYEDHDTAYLRHTETGRMLYFRSVLPSAKGKLSIETCWPAKPPKPGDQFGTRWVSATQYASYGCPQQGAINVSLERGPARIAKEIERRMVPGFFAACDWLDTRIAYECDFEAGQYATMERLAKISGDWPLGKFSQGREQYSTKSSPKYGAWASVRVHSADSVTVELNSIPADLAEQVLRLLFPE